jgi:K+-transporting ATPase ATPase C chain
VAEVRGLGVDAVLGLVEANTESRTLGMLGEPRVNVVDLNAQLAGLAR